MKRENDEIYGLESRYETADLQVLKRNGITWIDVRVLKCMFKFPQFFDETTLHTRKLTTRIRPAEGIPQQILTCDKFYTHQI